MAKGLAGTLAVLTGLLLIPAVAPAKRVELWLSQIQLLWDRGEANGYAHHMTSDPLPNTPATLCSCT
jgi:hypothetical protein